MQHLWYQLHQYPLLAHPFQQNYLVPLWANHLDGQVAGHFQKFYLDERKNRRTFLYAGFLYFSTAKMWLTWDTICLHNEMTKVLTWQCRNWVLLSCGYLFPLWSWSNWRIVCWPLEVDWNNIFVILGWPLKACIMYIANNSLLSRFPLPLGPCLVRLIFWITARWTCWGIQSIVCNDKISRLGQFLFWRIGHSQSRLPSTSSAHLPFLLWQPQTQHWRLDILP